MAENPIRRVPRISPAQSRADLYNPVPPAPLDLNTQQPETTHPRWKTLLIEMLNETNQAKRELAALALEEAIYERHRELTDQRSFGSESMAERTKMKEAFMRMLDVRSQITFADRAPLPFEFRHVPRRGTPDWESAEAEAADWRRLLLQMLREEDKTRLKRIADSLEGAIFTRYQQLAICETLEASEERGELQLACDRLAQVRINVLGYPDGKKAG